MNYTIKNPSEIGVYVQTSNIKTIAQVQKAIGADVLCNFQMFTVGTSDANFVLKVDGKVIGWDGENYWGFGWNKGDKTFTCDYAQSMAKYENFAGCIPILRDGKVINHVAGSSYPTAIGGSRGRTCIGLKADGSIVIYCWPDGSSGACKIEELGAKMLALGCVNAINFDGGGSTQMICPDGKVTTTRQIYNYLWFKLEDKPTTKPVCPYNEPKTNICYGSRGNGTKWVQWMLNQHGAELEVDGVFGYLSSEAMRAFQKKAFPNEPREWDGICGAKSREKLKEAHI